MKKHFVTFYSPGTFVAEQTTKEIDSWDIEKAKEMANSIKERYGASPYGFQFSTRERKDDELDSKVVKRSGMYYINCKIRTLTELKVENDPSNKTLISNMEGNGWDKVVQTLSGWQWTQPLNENDTVLTQEATHENPK